MYRAIVNKVCAWEALSSSEIRTSPQHEERSDAIPPINMLTHTHFVNYGGDYYAYLFAKERAQKIWEKHFRKKPLCRESGELIWQKMLKFGAARDPCLILNDLN